MIVSAALFAAQVGVGRHFGGLGLGEYSATTLAVYLSAIAAISGVPVVSSRNVAADHERRDSYAAAHTAGVGLSLVAVLGMAAGVTVGVIALVFAEAFNAQLAFLMLAPTAVVGVSLVSYSSQVLQSRLQIAASGLVLISQPLAVIASLGWVRLFPGMRPGEMALLGQVVSGGVGLLLLIMIGVRPRGTFSEVIRLFREALVVAPVVYAHVLSTWVDRLIVWMILGPAALGLYQAAAFLVEGPLRLLRGAVSFLMSAYGRATAMSTLHADRLRRVHIRLWSVYAVVIAGALIAGADGIVTTVYGPGFAAAHVPLRILATGLVPTAIALTLLTAGAGIDHRTALLIGRMMIPVQLGLGVTLALTFGITGAAVAHLAVMISVAVAQLHWSRDVELVLHQRSGRRLGVLAILAPGLALVIATTPLEWPLRSALGATIALMLGTTLLFGSEERAVVRRVASLRR